MEGCPGRDAPSAALWGRPASSQPREGRKRTSVFNHSHSRNQLCWEQQTLGGKKIYSLCKGNFFPTWGQAQESNCKGTGRESLGLKRNKRACHRPVSKEPHLHACHSPSSQTPIKWKNPSVQVLICSVWKLDAFLIEICMLSWFAEASKHINRRSYLKWILVRTCLLPRVLCDIIIDRLESWYLLPSLAPMLLSGFPAETVSGAPKWPFPGLPPIRTPSLSPPILSRCWGESILI